MVSRRQGKFSYSKSGIFFNIIFSWMLIKEQTSINQSDKKAKKTKKALLFLQFETTTPLGGSNIQKRSREVAPYYFLVFNAASENVTNSSALVG